MMENAATSQKRAMRAVVFEYLTSLLLIWVYSWPQTAVFVLSFGLLEIPPLGFWVKVTIAGFFLLKVCSFGYLLCQFRKPEVARFLRRRRVALSVLYAGCIFLGGMWEYISLVLIWQTWLPKQFVTSEMRAKGWAVVAVIVQHLATIFIPISISYPHQVVGMLSFGVIDLLALESWWFGFWGLFTQVALLVLKLASFVYLLRVLRYPQAADFIRRRRFGLSITYAIVIFMTGFWEILFLILLWTMTRKTDKWEQRASVSSE